jgi:hypothetical protein
MGSDKFSSYKLAMSGFAYCSVVYVNFVVFKTLNTFTYPSIYVMVSVGQCMHPFYTCHDQCWPVSTALLYMSWSVLASVNIPFIHVMISAGQYLHPFYTCHGQCWPVYASLQDHNLFLWLNSILLFTLANIVCRSQHVSSFLRLH